MLIGILGSGQLGRMLALAGFPLGFSFRFYDEKPGTPTLGLGELHTGAFNDLEKLQRFVEGCSVVTYEFENIPAEAVAFITKQVPTYPSVRALEVSQDRLSEKNFFVNLGYRTADYLPANTLPELEAAVKKIGFPCIVKTRRFGYDGKGQSRCRSEQDISEIWNSVGNVPLIVESLVHFDRELSVVAARSRSGQIAIYPLIQNEHRDGILWRSEIPAPQVSEQVTNSAIKLVSDALNALDYVGVLAIELFLCAETLFVNEMAPRVHNSGHITMDSCVTGQFENHLRAIAGLPLGSTEVITRGVLFNLIGSHPSLDSLTLPENCKVHLYGKTPAPGRKLGHINLLSPSRADEESIVKILLDKPLGKK